MIIENGFIKIRKSANTDFDSLDKNGYPVVSTEADDWGDPIPCHYVPVSLNYQAIGNGEKFTKASYKILINIQPFDVKSLRLFTKSDLLVGEYEIINIQQNDLVLTTRIII